MGSSSSIPPDDPEHRRILRERDIYRELLELGARDAVEPFLEEALALLVRATGASRGYIELIEDRDDGEPRFSLAHGCYDEDVEAIRAALSQGIIAEAIATGRTIVTESARRDPRFLGRRSVQQNRTEAVLCAPIGASPPLGVLYLQDRKEEAGFSEEDRRLVEIFARHLGTFADRLLERRRRLDAEDPTASARKALRAEGIIGRSRAMARTLDQIALVARIDIGVLILGPSGTGKTALARVLHESGPRAAKPFVEQSCANLSDSLFESQMFGHEKGSFTGADRRSLGCVGAAEGGTLFLDEIAELSLASQAKLLQLLQSKEYRPLGSPQLLQADVRIVAATNADLKEMVAKGTFREDLYYRLDVLPVRVAALVDRREDIVPIALHICRCVTEENRLPRLEVSAGACRALEAAEWPGNVRQLHNRVQEGALRAAAAGASAIEPRHLFRDDAPEPSSDELSFQEATRRFQKDLVERRLIATSWNIMEATRRLDISRAHLYNLIAAFGLKRKKT